MNKEGINMNIGAGIILLIFVVFLSLIALIIKRKSKKGFYIILSISSVFLIISILLLTGIYDPYADHIR